MSAPDPALVAAIVEALTAKGYTITPPAPPPAAPAQPAAPAPPQITRSPMVVCHRCGMEVDRKTARAEGWTRGPEGWVCHCHAPIDWMYGVDIAGSLQQEVDEIVLLLCKLDAAVLDHLDEAAYLLAELQALARPLRQKPAA